MVLSYHGDMQRAGLTLDVEDWDHANFSQLKERGMQIADSVKSRAYAMDANTDHWIEILAEFDAKSTCFVLGEFARRYPEAVRRLSNAGHEIASHGDSHDLIYEMTQKQFADALEKAVGTLGDLLGKKPIGFRAPSWSVDNKRTPWFMDELERQDFKYDSSEFPVNLGLYGNPSAPLSPYRIGKILRIPVTVLTCGPIRLPFATGAFFRLWPQVILKWGLVREARRNHPPMVVLHPREFDPGHPRLPLSGFEAWVHYTGLKTTEPKLRNLSRYFQWQSLQQIYKSEFSNTSKGS